MIDRTTYYKKDKKRILNRAKEYYKNKEKKNKRASNK